MLRVSTTTVELFRRFQDPDQSWLTEAELLANIRGDKFTPTPEMRLGWAFDAVISNPEQWRTPDGYRCRGFYFPFEVADPAIAMFDHRGVFQVKATKEYGDIELVSKADQLIGTTIIENKTSLKPFYFEKYDDSFQWRVMVDTFEARACEYKVFHLETEDDGATSYKGVERLTVYPYRGMRDDILELLARFREYVALRELAPFLENMHARFSGASL